MGDSLPPKKLWLSRRHDAPTERPPVTSNCPDARERESSDVPEAAVSMPGGTPPVLQTPERSRTTDSEVTVPSSPREHSPGTLQTGCFEAMRNALRSSVIRFVAPKRKRRRAAYEPSSAPRNESPTGRGKESTRRGSDHKSDRVARRRSFDPESSGDSGSGCSPRKRALQAAPNEKSDRTKTSLEWADLEEPTASGFAEASGEKDADTWMPSEVLWASEDTAGCPDSVFEEPGQPSFSRSLPEAFKGPEQIEPIEPSSASTSRPVIDVDRLMMPPPPVPWVKLARRKMRQLTPDSTSQMSSPSLFSAAHFHKSYAEQSQSSTSSQSSASTDVAQQSRIARPRTLSLGNERVHRKQSISGEALPRSFSFGSERQHRRPSIWSEARKAQPHHSNEEVDLSCKERLTSYSANREFDPISHVRTGHPEGEVPLSEYQESERRGSSPDIGKLSLEAQPEDSSFRESQYADRVSVCARRDSGIFQEKLTQRSVLDDVSGPYAGVSRDAGCSEADKSSAPQWLSSKEDRQELRWKSATPRYRGGSSKDTAIDVDDISVPAASEYLHHDTAANLAEAAIPPAASSATIWVPTKTSSFVMATDFAMVPQTPTDAQAINVQAAPETPQHDTAVDVTGTAVSTAEPGSTIQVPTKAASPTTTTDMPTVSHRFLSW